MAYTIVASGTADNLASLGDYQSYYGEGESGYLRVDLSSSVAADIIGQLDDLLDEAGILGKRLEVQGKSLFIHFRIGFAWLALIPIAIAAVFLIWGLIVAWKLYKLSPAAVVGLSVGVILAIVAITAVVIVLVTKLGGRLAAGPVQVGR